MVINRIILCARRDLFFGKLDNKITLLENWQYLIFYLLLQESKQNLVWSNNDMWSASYVYLIKPRKKFLRGFELWWACGFKHKLIWWLHTLFDFLYIIGWYQRYFILSKRVLLNKNIWIHGIRFSFQPQTVFICKLK